MSRFKLGILRRREPLQVGFLPVSDCAPLVYAAEAGLFEEYGLEVELRRESSWTGIRDKIIEGELDAAHAPVSAPFLANIGLESDPCSCVTGMVLSLQGNAIAVSKALWDSGVRDAASLRDQVYKNWRKRTYTFGIVFPFSAPDILLRQWLKAAGITPDVEVRIVAIPPAQMYPTLKLGYIDGYCVGEPWASLAVQAGAGVCIATSAELAPLHPEKVLMVRQSFAAGRAEEHERLLAALLEACAFCDQPQNRPLLSEMLADPRYVNAPAECVRAGLAGFFESHSDRIRNLLNLAIFHRYNANEPSDDKASWIMARLDELLQQSVFKQRRLLHAPVLKNIFRQDIYERACAVVRPKARPAAPERRVFLEAVAQPA